jgi:hypothetical protein
MKTCRANIVRQIGMVIQKLPYIGPRDKIPEGWTAYIIWVVL